MGLKCWQAPQNPTAPSTKVGQSSAGLSEHGRPRNEVSGLVSGLTAWDSGFVAFGIQALGLTETFSLRKMYS